MAGIKYALKDFKPNENMKKHDTLFHTKRK